MKDRREFPVSCRRNSLPTNASTVERWLLHRVHCVCCVILDPVACIGVRVSQYIRLDMYGSSLRQCILCKLHYPSEKSGSSAKRSSPSLHYRRDRFRIDALIRSIMDEPFCCTRSAQFYTPAALATRGCVLMLKFLRLHRSLSSDIHVRCRLSCTCAHAHIFRSLDQCPASARGQVSYTSVLCPEQSFYCHSRKSRLWSLMIHRTIFGTQASSLLSYSRHYWIYTQTVKCIFAYVT